MKQTMKQTIKRGGWKALGIVSILCLPALQIMPSARAAQNVSPRAAVDCRPAGGAQDTHAYDCTIRVSNAHSGAPLPGARFSVTADMPTMPMAHAMAPVDAVPVDAPGSYRVRLNLEMAGRWQLKLRFASPVRDLLVSNVELGDAH